MIGYKIKNINGFKWYISNHCLLPFDLSDYPKITRCQAWLPTLRYRVLLVRWDSLCKDNKNWWNVVFTGSYSLESLRKKVRYEIRKGIAKNIYRKVDADEIIESGYEVYKSAYTRYQTYEKILSKEKFKINIKTMPDSIEFRAVYNLTSGSMVAFTENIVQHKKCFMSTMWFTPEALDERAGYFLIHKILEEYINERDFLYVSDGSRNIGHQTNIHDFLIKKFYFHQKKMKLNIVYNPLIFFVVKILYYFKKFFPIGGKLSTLMTLEKYSR